MGPVRADRTGFRRLFLPTVAIRAAGKVDGKIVRFPSFLCGDVFYIWTRRDKMEVLSGHTKLLWATTDDPEIPFQSIPRQPRRA